MKIYLWVYRLTKLLSRSIPRRFAYWISLRIADMYYFFDRTGRDAVLANLRQVFAFKGQNPTDAQLKPLARQMFQFFGKYLVDFFRFSRLTEDEIERLVTVEHPEFMAEAQQAGKGVIVVTAHLGNWELGGAAFASMGHTLNAVVLRQPSVKLNEFFQRHRRSRGMRIIPLGQALRQLIQALARRECVALLADRDYSRRNDFVSLCGAPACLPRGPAWLAHATHAPILPVFVLRRDDDTFVLRFYPPIVPDGRKTRDELQQEICAVLEHVICENPSQWFVFERVWDGRNYGGCEAADSAALRAARAGRQTAVGA